MPAGRPVIRRNVGWNSGGDEDLGVPHVAADATAHGNEVMLSVGRCGGGRGSTGDVENTDQATPRGFSSHPRPYTIHKPGSQASAGETANAHGSLLLVPSLCVLFWPLTVVSRQPHRAVFYPTEQMNKPRHRGCTPSQSHTVSDSAGQSPAFDPNASVLPSALQT